jgi:hypothetical protein
MVVSSSYQLVSNQTLGSRYVQAPLIRLAEIVAKSIRKMVLVGRVYRS